MGCEEVGLGFGGRGRGRVRGGLQRGVACACLGERTLLLGKDSARHALHLGEDGLGEQVARRVRRAELEREDGAVGARAEGHMHMVVHMHMHMHMRTHLKSSPPS